ncbi:MAG: hypothetical protein BWY82_02963 [Verrucomicrobia bacterium ADurb.Bin474]|nr:MAG: hypothetical protein BWY82_02963 [Verrucomicrobia bacterium ADurb.Bin474]
MRGKIMPAHDDNLIFSQADLSAVFLVNDQFHIPGTSQLRGDGDHIADHRFLTVAILITGVHLAMPTLTGIRIDTRDDPGVFAKQMVLRHAQLVTDNLPRIDITGIAEGNHYPIPEPDIEVSDFRTGFRNAFLGDLANQILSGHRIFRRQFDFRRCRPIGTVTLLDDQMHRVRSFHRPSLTVTQFHLDIVDAGIKQQIKTGKVSATHSAGRKHCAVVIDPMQSLAFGIIQRQLGIRSRITTGDMLRIVHFAFIVTTGISFKDDPFLREAHRGGHHEPNPVCIIIAVEVMRLHRIIIHIVPLDLRSQLACFSHRVIRLVSHRDTAAGSFFTNIFHDADY